MSHQLKMEYLNAIRERYKNSNRSKKSIILDEFCLVCGYVRKYAIAILNGQVDPCIVRPRGRKLKYTPNVIFQLERLWQIMGQPGSTKFKAALPEWIEYDEDPAVRDSLEMRSKLKEISRPQLDRVLRPLRRGPQTGLSGTRPAHEKIKHRIPIQPKDWNITEPGQQTQADTVAHCGESLQGTFINSITITDIDSTWTENRAMWGKPSAQVIIAMKDIEASLPFILRGFKSDSGSEFINYELLAYFTENRPDVPVAMTRSRPYKKDDNCYVEQKNFTHVRELFGYERLDFPELVPMMNEIYKHYWGPLQNFFLPTQKLLRKTRIGARIKKEYDEAQTPYQRLINSAGLSSKQKEDLMEKKKKLNPFHLTKGLQKKINEIEEFIRQRKTGLIAA